jgi:predicted house-cleaning noncanonical NTP pyrophosphatase (MazG superfamily)
MQNIDEFVDRLLSEKGVTNADSTYKEELKEKILSKIDETALEQLNDTQLAELVKLVEDPTFDDDKMRSYITNVGININNIAMTAMQAFRSQFLLGGQYE